DGTRAWGPPWHEGQSSYFKAVNRNKASIVLNLAVPADQALATELACRADILVENFLPGQMAKFGLGYQQLAAMNPALIYCSISGFGSQPAGAELPGYDLIA